MTGIVRLYSTRPRRSSGALATVPNAHLGRAGGPAAHVRVPILWLLPPPLLTLGWATFRSKETELTTQQKALRDALFELEAFYGRYVSATGFRCDEEHLVLLYERRLLVLDLDGHVRQHIWIAPPLRGARVRLCRDVWSEHHRLDFSTQLQEAVCVRVWETLSTHLTLLRGTSFDPARIRA